MKHYETVFWHSLPRIIPKETPEDPQLIPVQAMNEACTWVLGTRFEVTVGYSNLRPRPNLSVPGVGAQRFQSTPCKVRSLCLSLGLSGPVMTAGHVKCQCITSVQNIEGNSGVQYFFGSRAAERIHTWNLGCISYLCLTSVNAGDLRWMTSTWPWCKGTVLSSRLQLEALHTRWQLEGLWCILQCRALFWLLFVRDSVL